MYAVLAVFTLGAGKQNLAETVADRSYQALQKEDGFVDATFLKDDAQGKYAAMILWKSKKAAENTKKELDAKLNQALRFLSPGAEVTIDVYEIYAPKQ